MAALLYLTVQDILWIHFELSGEQLQRWNALELEEACFYQYAYGQSGNLLPQAARFLTGFVAKGPLPSANEATAAIAALTFLDINGMEVTLDAEGAAGWLQQALQGESQALAALESAVQPAAEHHHAEPELDVKAYAQPLMERYGAAFGAPAAARA